MCPLYNMYIVGFVSLKYIDAATFAILAQMKAPPLASPPPRRLAS